MIIHEGGAVKALNAAYKKGYEIAPLGAGLIGIYTECWALEIPMQGLPALRKKGGRWRCGTSSMTGRKNL